MFENKTNNQPNNSNELNAWNPLEQSDDALSQVQQKRLIRNILKSYTGYYDFLSEPLQNALDATANFQDRNSDQSYHPKIWIRISLKESYISITDNGIGMNLEQFKKFLQPFCTYKDGLPTRGSKGVGATYLAYGFNHLEIATKNTQGFYCGLIKNGRTWIQDKQNEQSMPLVEPFTEAYHEIFDMIKHGTSITLKLVGDFIRPKDLTWSGAEKAEQWMSILRLMTPLGGIYLCHENPQKVEIELEVIDEAGEITQEILERPRYLFPHEVVGKTANIQEYFSCLTEKISKGQDPSRPIPKYSNLNGLWGEWTGKDIAEGKTPIEIELNKEEIELVIGTKIYVFLGYSEQIWEQYNDKHLNLRKGLNILRGGLQLATKNMPQGRQITIPFPNNVGLQKLAHVIVHFESEYYKNDDADPDLGRKGFQPELVEVAEKLSMAAVKTFRKHHKLLRKDKGKSAYEDELQISKWIDSQKDHEKTAPIIVSSKGFYASENYSVKRAVEERLPMRSEPICEQDVVALFNQMLGAAIIRGIHILASSQYQQYDACYRIFMENPFDDYIRSEQNLLGVDESSFFEELKNNKNRETKEKLLEYKHNIDALIDNFNEGTKKPKEIGLVVAWEMGKKWKNAFDVTSYLDEENVHHRTFHGCTHKMTHQGIGADAFDCIILKDLLNYLNNPAEESERQRELYS
jgi:hypothetical protein